MKSTISFLSLFLLTFFNVMAQFDSTYWYSNGIPDYWYYQPDMFAFKAVGGGAYTGAYDSTVIDSIVYRPFRRDKANEVYFSVGTTLQQVAQSVQAIYNSGQLQSVYPVITKTIYNAQLRNYYIVDDLILVSFEDTAVTSSQIDDFMVRWDLSEVYRPDSNAPKLRYTYVFRVNALSEATPDFIDLARAIHFYETGFIHSVHPNIVNAFHSSKEIEAINNSVVLGGNGTSCTVGMGYASDMWHIYNDGTVSNTINGGSTVNATAGADANICPCWATGNAGQWVDVVVIADGDFNMNHFDMVNSYRGGNNAVDCTSGNCLAGMASNNFPSIRLPSMIAGGIAAQNNGIYGTTGVAYEAKITPMKVENDLASVVVAFNYIISTINVSWSNTPFGADWVDLIVLGLFSDMPWQPLQDAIVLHEQDIQNTGHGRGGFGTTIITTTGFCNTNQPTCSITTPSYPAAYPNHNIISVIGSTPEDYTKNIGDGWGTLNLDYAARIGDANAGLYYTVAAPSSLFFAPAELNDIATSIDPIIGALATTAGVAAIMLEANFYIDPWSLRSIVGAGSNQVGGYSYIYNGVISNEMGRGRINCANTLNYITPITVQEGVEKEIFIYNNPIQDKLSITLQNEHGTGNLDIFDIAGRLISTTAVAKNDLNVDIQLTNISNGMYIIRFRGIEKQGHQVGKFIKID